MTDDLVAFLRARLDEDARTAQAAEQDEGEASWTDGGKYGEKVHTSEYGSPVAVGPWTGLMGDGTRGHIARHDPARVLREVEAKRRVVERHADCGSGGGYCDDGGHGWDHLPSGGCAELADLAAVYAGHPDYREEWRPN